MSHTPSARWDETFPLHLSVGEMSIKGERKFTGMLHDLSKRAHLEQELRTSEARWRSVIESAVDGIVVIDAHGRIEGFNPAAEHLFGYQERDCIGRNVNMLMPSPMRVQVSRRMSGRRSSRLSSPRRLGDRVSVCRRPSA